MGLKDEILRELDDYIQILRERAEEEREYACACEKERDKWKWVAHHRIEAQYGSTKQKTVMRQAAEISQLGDEYERIPSP